MNVVDERRSEQKKMNLYNTIHFDYIYFDIFKITITFKLLFYKLLYGRANEQRNARRMDQE